MDLRLELIPVPVSDVDRAKEFYAERAGFNVDNDVTVREGLRFVQLTPPGSGCSVSIGEGITEMEPGSLEGLQLVVDDIEAARDELSARGLEVSDIQDFPWGRFVSSATQTGTVGRFSRSPTTARDAPSPRAFSRWQDLKRLSGAGSAGPELVVELSRLLTEPGRIAVGDRPGDGHQQGSLEQRLAVIGLDRRSALLARGPVSIPGRVAPPRHRAAAEVASHEHMFP